MSSTIELTNGKATLEQRGEYLLVVETGTIVSPHEVYRYVTELELASQRMKLRRMLVDARSESGQESPETRTAMWRWIRSQRYFDQVAYALRDEMTIARVNMTALSEKLGVRAFPSVPEAHRWLARSAGRMSSTMLPAASSRGPSSVPPPPMTGSGSTPPHFSSSPTTERHRRITVTDLQPATPPVTPATPVPRSYVTLKTPAIDPASADEILRKRR